MKILCIYTPCGPSYVRSGWGRVFAACGHDFRFWTPESKSAHDAFGEFEPDVAILTTYDCDRALAKCIAARPNMKVAMFGSAWGHLLKDIDTKKYPLVITSESEKKLLAKLKEETGKPDFVFVHVSDKYLDGTMGGWKSIGIKPVGILNAADTFVYLDGTSKPELKCDVGFCGGYWPYKARNLDRYILPLCHPSAGLKVKIFSNSPWPVAQYLGGIADADVANLFASATVCPNVSEPHSTDLGWDVIERVFKVPASGGFLISDKVKEIDEIFISGRGTIPQADSTKDMFDMIQHYVAHPEERDPVIKRTRRNVLLDHTYFERVHQMWTEFGLEAEAARVLKVKGEILKGKI